MPPFPALKRVSKTAPKAGAGKKIAARGKPAPAAKKLAATRKPAPARKGKVASSKLAESTKKKKPAPAPAKKAPAKKATPRKAARAFAPPPRPIADVDRKPKPKPKKAALDGLDKIRDILAAKFGGRVTLAMITPEPGMGRTPWAVIGELKGFDVSYAEMADVLRRIEDNGRLSELLGERTYSRISVTYNGAKEAGRKGRTKREWTVGEIAPWGVTSARATNAVNTAKATYGKGGPGNPAGASRAVGLKVWLSTDLAKDMIDDGGNDEYDDE